MRDGGHPVPWLEPLCSYDIVAQNDSERTREVENARNLISAAISGLTPSPNLDASSIYACS